MTAHDSITPVQHMICSCTGALATSLLVTPLDVVKIRLQAQQKQFVKNKCFLYCNGLMEHMCYCLNGNGNGNGHNMHSMASGGQWYKRPGHFNGTFDAFIKIARNEGITSLWSGLPPTLVMAVPATMLYFTAYDQMRGMLCARMEVQPALQPIWIPAMSGATARVFSATLISPLEMVRTKMQSKRLSYFEIGQAVRSLVNTRGVLSLYTGLGPTLLRDVPFSCIYWSMYELLKRQCKQTEPTFMFSFAAGATAGTISAVVTLPFDVVKTHKQIELGEMEIMKERRSTSTFTIMRDLYQSRGVKGLFSGIVPRISKVAPACAVMISIYEFGKKFFRQKNAARRSAGVL
uniref:Putative mitochondrial carrier protein cgi-69 n=1 Tax=Ixodes ricinus TaxID=34613 RepID=A0A0K8RJJ3_IXORI